MSLPSCFDRADGVTLIPDGYGGYLPAVGTPDPSGAVITRGTGGLVCATEEFPDSPEIERAEQATITHRFKMDWAQALTKIAATGRGKLEVDSFGNVTRVLSAKAQHAKGGVAEFTKVSESVSFDTPWDEFAVTPFELGINIIKHPRYFYALDPTVTDQTVGYNVGNVTVYLSTVKQTIIRAIQTYIDSPVYPSADNINGLLQNNVANQINSGYIQVPYYNPSFDSTAEEVDPPQWPTGTTATKPAGNWRYALVNVPTNVLEIQYALAAAKEIITKVWRQEDTPYVVGYKIMHVRYYFRPPKLNPGGYLENPITEAQPGLPDYFGSPSGNYAIDTIFDDIADFNPQCYQDPYTLLPSISCLRQADECEFQRTWFRLTRSWLCVPVGHWDTDLYTRGNYRPNPLNYLDDPPVGYRKLTA